LKAIGNRASRGEGSAKKAVEAVNKDVETRDFVKALINGDGEKLKKMTTSTADTSKAGYNIPTALLAEVMRIKEEGYGIARREMRYLPFSGAGNSRDIPALSGSVSTYWTGEGVAKTSTQATFAKVAQVLKKLAAIVPLTEELIEDSAVNLTQLIAELFVEAVSIEEDTQFFNGDGTVFLGILNDTGAGRVPKFTLPATKITFASATADDYLDLQYKVKTSARSKGKYYMHPTVVASVMKLKASGSGEYIYAMPANGKPATLWNKEVVECDALPTTSQGTQTNKPFAIFGDLKQACVYGDKGEMQVKLLDQATIHDTDGSTVINLAEQDMIGIRVVERVGYAIVLQNAVAVLQTNSA
jgi:HK97 family phage major capsid protein